MKKILYSSAAICCIIFLLFFITRCSSTNNKKSAANELAVQVNPDFFIMEGLLEPITKVDYKLSDGSTTECYKIVTKSTPTEHAMGPWCPTNINDGADKGGIWMEGGKVYDVDGAFIKNMAIFYKDTKWKMYNADGSINVTNTKEACEAAARPDVDAAYQNFCVQCIPSYVSSLKQTFYIPVTPVKETNANANNNQPNGPPQGADNNRPPRGEQNGPPPNGGRRLQGGGSVIGIAFNGVNFDPPAPTADILKHYTLAPLDDNGGHINPHVGYHYHAATGKTKKIKQADGHAAMIGYAMDGYGLFELLDEAGKEPVDLDNLRGHYDTLRGYHYHVGPAGGNKFINGFRGKTGGFSASF